MFQKQILFAVSALSLVAVQNSGVQARGTKFSLPDGTVGLFVTSPNASGDVGGSFFNGKFHHSYGFVRLADGSFTTIDLRSYKHSTFVEAIDDAGDVVGQYASKHNPNVEHAFIRTPDGTVTSFDAPGAYDTMPFDINSHTGAMVGWYYTANGNHAFMRSMDGTFTTIDYPGATGTYAYAINASGQITGSYADSAVKWHGFLRQPDGSFETIDPQNSAWTDNVVLNDQGQISGFYQDATSGIYYGFVRDRGTFYPFEQSFGRLNARHRSVGQSASQTFRLTFRHGVFETQPINPPTGCSNLFLDGINDSGLMSGSMQCGAGKWFGYLTKK